MPANLSHWEPGVAVTETAIQAAYRARSLTPYSWSNAPGERYRANSHDYAKVLYCLRGSIVFVVDGEEVAMRPGDRLDLPAGTSHAAVVGPQGGDLPGSPPSGLTASTATHRLHNRPQPLSEGLVAS